MRIKVVKGQDLVNIIRYETRWFRRRVLGGGALPSMELICGGKIWHENGVYADRYHANFGCRSGDISSRSEALYHLNRKPRPYSRPYYLADIDKKWPIWDDVDKAIKDSVKNRDRSLTLQEASAILDHMIEDEVEKAVQSEKLV